MDFSKFKAVDAIRVDIDHADCEGVSITLAGPSHPATKKAERTRMDAMANSKRRLKGDALKSLVSEFLAARVLSWEGVSWGGEAMEANEENALKLLNSPAGEMIQNQLLMAIGNDDLLYKSN
jgi:hypothetical protein